MILSVGATGLVGLEAARFLAAQQMAVRALVRSSSDPAKLEKLRESGASLVVGDLKDASSIRNALRDVDIVVSSASVTLSRQPGDSIQSVDLEGQLALIDAAADAGVKHFVFVSFPALHVDCALQRSKRAVEERIQSKFASYTILQPVNFNEIWLSAAVGFDSAHGQVTVWGSGRNRTNWISAKDVAWYTAQAAINPVARNQILPLGGPEALSQLEVVALFEGLGSPTITVQHVPVNELQSRFESAADPIDEAFAALMLNTAHGWVADASRAHRILPRELTSVRKYARENIESHRRDHA